LTEQPGCSTIPLSGIERQFVSRFVAQLNSVVKSAAITAGFQYLQPLESALCGGPKPVGINSLRLNPKAGSLWASLNPLNWTHNSLHPNEDGHEAIFQKARVWFEEHPNIAASTPSNVEPTTVPTMASLFQFGSTKLCQADGSASCDVKHLGWLYEQGLRLLRADILILLVGCVGSWMILVQSIRWSFRNRLSLVSILLRLVQGRAGDAMPFRWQRV
jgi:hypothetical protein